MEAEAEVVNTGDWAMPYGNFFVEQYSGFKPVKEVVP